MIDFGKGSMDWYLFGISHPEGHMMKSQKSAPLVLKWHMTNITYIIVIMKLTAMSPTLIALSQKFLRGISR